MAQLGAKARAGLPDSSFAYIDPTGRRLLPIHDEAHVRNALARFRRVIFDDEAARDRARTRLLKAAKRYGIVPVGFIDGELRPERRLPTGRVSLLLADVENSTGHLTNLGDRYPRLLADVRRLLRKATRESAGFEVDARADEFFAAFADPDRALAAAIAMQRSIAAHAWTDGRTVLVRIGLHVGRPTLTASGYVGIAVNTVSRLSDLGHGRQILASSALRDLVGDADGIGWRPLGAYRLRGIPDHHELFQVEAAGLPTEFPPLRTSTTDRNEMRLTGHRVPHGHPAESGA
jgi:class 3 adenylate cyclase